MQKVDKEKLFHLVLAGLEEKLEAAQVSAAKAHETSVDEENIPEHKYDTLALEASYLAEGQAQRVTELENQIIRLKNFVLKDFLEGAAIDLGAYVELIKEDDTQLFLFLLPEAGGSKVKLNEKEIIVISQDSPLAQELIGKSLEDEVELKRSDQSSFYEVSKIL